MSARGRALSRARTRTLVVCLLICSALGVSPASSSGMKGRHGPSGQRQAVEAVVTRQCGGRIHPEALVSVRVTCRRAGAVRDAYRRACQTVTDTSIKLDTICPHRVRGFRCHARGAYFDPVVCTRGPRRRITFQSI